MQPAPERHSGAPYNEIRVDLHMLSTYSLQYIQYLQCIQYKALQTVRTGHREPALHPVHAVLVLQWYRCITSTTSNEGSVGSTTAAALQYQQVIGTILRS